MGFILWTAFLHSGTDIVLTGLSEPELFAALGTKSVSDPSATPWTAARQAPRSMGFPRQEYWSGLSLPTPGDLPDPGIEPTSSCISCIGRQIIYHRATREAQTQRSQFKISKTNPDYEISFNSNIHFSQLKKINITQIYLGVVLNINKYIRRILLFSNALGNLLNYLNKCRK